MSFFLDLLDLTLPQRCVGCSAKSTRSDGHLALVCRRCAMALKGSPHKVRVRGVTESEFPIMAAAAYEGSTRNLLLAAKERNQVALIPMLASATSIAITQLLARSEPDQKLALIPIPSMPKNLRNRGYNLVGQMTNLLAREMAMRFDDVRVVEILRHRRHVADQSRLSASARAANLHGAFSTLDLGGPLLTDRRVIIIDDLVTTGATLIEARRSLIAAGIRPFGAVCAMSSD
ncbi:MAG TPA: phosphoribosyltransferase family protein [Candidatus Nanopelagicaceae bacterium]|nr:phosphoribosyltransferase family protein [Candidatus Nanopelagicaceae bacterium]